MRRLSNAVLLAAGLALALSTRLAGFGPAELPTKLTDQEFWRLSDELSEPNGSFQSDNLLSNELVFARAVPDLVARTKPGGVYLGVGPEQNFTYIAAMQPRMVFITDIRRGNLHLQLMYKALFELSADRVEFVSRLFTKARPAGLTAASRAADLFAAYWDVASGDEAAFAANLKAVQDLLTKRHALPLSAEDLQGVAQVYRAFYWYGPWMTYNARTDLSSPPGSAGTTYRALMTQADAAGQEHSYLASEEKFNFLKSLESRNLLVPVVGNFAGPKALRAVGAYVRDHGAIVNAFYLSNVESYLRRGDGALWNAFCASVATFPLDATSVFIRPSGNGGRGLQVLPAGWQFTPPPTGATGGTNAPPVPMVPIRFVTVSGTNSTRSVLDPIAEEVKACSGGYWPPPRAGAGRTGFSSFSQ